MPNKLKQWPVEKNVWFEYKLNAEREDVNKPLYGADVFIGAWIDSGAEPSVIGIDQAQTYQVSTGRVISSDTSPLTLWFGYSEKVSKRLIDVKGPLHTGATTYIEVHIVKADIPLLIRIEIIHQYRLTLDFCKSIIRDDEGGWKTPIKREYVHIFL